MAVIAAAASHTFRCTGQVGADGWRAGRFPEPDQEVWRRSPVPPSEIRVVQAGNGGVEVEQHVRAVPGREGPGFLAEGFQ